MKKIIRTLFALFITIGIFLTLLFCFTGSVIWYFRIPIKSWNDFRYFFFDYDCYAVIHRWHSKWAFVNLERHKIEAEKNNWRIVIHKNWFEWAWSEGKLMTWFEYDFEQRKSRIQERSIHSL